MLSSHSLRPRAASAFDFAEQIFAHLPRADQRRWAHTYLEGLLRTPGKKTLRRLAASVSDSPTASQSLHQFANDSPWDWNPAYRELMNWAEDCLPPRAWVVDVAVLRKRGEHSCGVHRRFAPGTGRSVTCQVGVGGFLVTEEDAVPVDWRLLLPKTWTENPSRRHRARIPRQVTSAGLEDHAVDLIQTMGERARTASVPVVADLTDHTPSAQLVHELAAQGRDFVVGVPDRLPLAAGHQLTVPRRERADNTAVLEAGRLFDPAHLTGGGTESATISDGCGRPTVVQSALVHLPGPRSAGPAPPRTFRLLALRSPRQRRPAALWLTNMVHKRLDELLALSRLRARATRTVQHLEAELGLRDFEGRSYPGWHHHMTLVSAAYAHRQLNLADADADADDQAP